MERHEEGHELTQEERHELTQEHGRVCLLADDHGPAGAGEEDAGQQHGREGQRAPGSPAGQDGPGHGGGRLQVICPSH